MAVKKGIPQKIKKNGKLGASALKMPPASAVGSSMLLPTPLIQAIIAQESGWNKNLLGDDGAIGDKTLPAHAYGPMQIRQPVVTDVNNNFGTSYTALDMLGNRTLSIWCFHAYMDIYARPDRLGRTVTDQDRARIWNGGPNGYKIAATLGYWALIQEKAKLLKVTLA